MQTLIGQIPIFLIGLAVVQIAWKGSRPSDWLVKIFLAQGLGMGIDACLYYLWSLAFTPFNRYFFWIELFLAAGAAVVIVITILKSHPVFSLARPHFSHPWFVYGLAAVFLVAFASTSVLYVREIYGNLSGSFDAYAIWNFRARFIYYSPQDWKLAFSEQFDWKTHPDYPLLWSMNILRTWILLGREVLQAGRLQTSIFYVILPGLMVGGLLKLRGWSQALLGGAILFGMPAFMLLTSFQIPETPLAYFYLACLLLLLLYEKERTPGLLALAGLAAGMAGWTKNEGLMFAAAAVVFMMAGSLHRPLRPGLVRLGWFGLGLALPLGTALAFKAFLAPPGDLIGTQTVGELVAKVLDPSRYGTIGVYVANYLAKMGGWSWPVALAIPLYMLAAGRNRAHAGWRNFWILGITFAGYIGIYLITPHPLEWHLNYSLERLMYQLLVPSIFLVLALIRSPEEMPGFLF